MAVDPRIQEHYASADIVGRIRAALAAVNGADAPITVEALAPIDHFHGRRLAATKEMAERLGPRAGEEILDIGCGIGGPARWIAATFDCRVTGVDLIPEFCAAARELNAITGLADKVRIVEGSATDLPLPDAAFDRAYSQNAVMNIADKPAFYREALRVLRPGGVFALSALCLGPTGAPAYPAPWAETAATSFLVTPEEMRAGLAEAGFEIVSFRDTSAEIMAQQRRHREQLENAPLPPLGVHIVMGARMREAQIVSRRNHEEGRVATIEALMRKPG